jgi:hypothetical protein
MDVVALEDAGIRPRWGFDAWDKDGRFKFRCAQMKYVFFRRAKYFRVNSTGKIYRIESRYKTVEVRVAPAVVSASAASPVL